MSDSVRPHKWQPTRLPRPWDSPGKNTGVGCHFLLQCMKVKSESEVTQVRPSASPWTAAYQVPPSMGFSRQEYWSWLPLPSPNRVANTRELVSGSAGWMEEIRGGQGWSLRLGGITYLRPLSWLVVAPGNLSCLLPVDVLPGLHGRPR